MKLSIGQTWNTRDGRRAEVRELIADNTYPWRVQVPGGGMLWYVADNGRFEIDAQSANDLVELVDPLLFEAKTDFSPSYRSLAEDGAKLSNPKEAMGDKKVPLWLCSTIAMAHWAAAQVAGYVKYGAWNWRAAGVRCSTYLSAMARHLGRYTNGERLDPVDGTHHLGNIMACCAILLEAEAIGKLTDDRPPKADAALAKAMEEVEAICARLKVQYADKAPKHWTIEDEIPS